MAMLDVSWSCWSLVGSVCLMSPSWTWDHVAVPLSICSAPAYSQLGLGRGIRNEGEPGNAPRLQLDRCSQCPCRGLLPTRCPPDQPDPSYFPIH